MTSIYLVVDYAEADDGFREAYINNDRDKVKENLTNAVSQAFDSGAEPVSAGGAKDPSFEVGELLSNTLGEPTLCDDYGKPISWKSESGKPDRKAFLYVPITLEPEGFKVTAENLEKFNGLVKGARGTGADLGLQAAYLEAPQWSRRHGPGGGRGTRREALRAIGGDFLANQNHKGQKVNVVVVDQGLDRHRISENFRGGWPVATGAPSIPKTRLPGALEHVRGVTKNDHGMLIARNVLSVAPAVRLYDCPLIPDRIEDVNAFLARADSVLWWVRWWIVFLRGLELIEGPWLVVNAWAIFDRSTEVPRGDYSENGAHHFNEEIRRFGDDDIDVVFAAGNCGGFGYDDRRCGPYDVGAGRSIFGAHAHSCALTVGSMRVDGLWAGSSSQGPGPEDMSPTGNLVTRKPDLCAPSHFSDPHDAHRFNGGTSSASAIAAGAIAALRSDGSGLGEPSSELMYQALRQSAVRAGAPRWDGRLGFGMLNAEGAFRFLQNGAPHKR